MTPPVILATLRLIRLTQNTFATYGYLVDAEDKRECVTLELPWLDNAHNMSCIPATGSDRPAYTAERYLSPHHGYVVFRLLDVPGREFVEFHIANLPRDLKGCIGVGSAFGISTLPSGETGPGITGSRTAFKAFMIAHPEQRFRLRVFDPLPDVLPVLTPALIPAA